MKLLSRKPQYNFNSFADTGLEDIPLRSSLFISENNSYYIYVSETGVTPATNLEEAYNNGNIVPMNWDGKSIDGFMPNPYNIPISRAGDQSFLPLPAYTDYKGSAYPLRCRDAFIAGSDGHIYMYQLRSNFIETRVYVSYYNDDLSSVIFTSFEYRPTFLSSDEYVDWIYEANDHGMHARINNTSGRPAKHYWIYYNNTENPAYHTHKDITSIWNSSATYCSITYVQEKNIFIEAHSEGTTSGNNIDSYIIYNFYNDNFSLLGSQEGLRVVWNNTTGNDPASDFIFPDIYKLNAPIYHSGWIQLQYKIDGDEIHLKNFIPLLYYLSNSKTYYYPEYLDYIVYNTSSTAINFVNPPEGLPMDIEDPNNSYLSNVKNADSSYASYWFAFKIYQLFDGLYVSRTIASNSSYHQVHYTEFSPGNSFLDYNDAFDKHFNFNKINDKSLELIPPDNSPSGKNVRRVNIVRLFNETGTPSDYATLMGWSKDPDLNQINSNNVLVSGVDVNNINNYIPTKIETIPRNPLIVYLKNTENHNRIYDISFTTTSANTNESNEINILGYNNGPEIQYADFQDHGGATTNATIQEFYRVNDLKNDTPTSITTFTFEQSFKQQLIDDVRQNISNEILTTPFEYKNVNLSYYPLIGTDFLLVSIQQSYLKEANSPGFSVYYCFYVIDPNTNTIKQPLTKYHHEEEKGYMSDVTVTSNYGISIYDNSSVDGYYYVWAFLEGRVPVGGSYSRPFRLKIDKNTGMVPDSSTINGSGFASWEELATGVHPILGFYKTDCYSPTAYMAANMRNSTGSDLVTAWANDPVYIGTCASIRSSIGLSITFGEYPVMFNGHYEIMPFQTIDNLDPNSKYYIYIYRSSDGSLSYKLSKIVLPETLVNIYIGWIQTDNIGVSASHLNKVVNLNNVKFNESHDTLTAPTLTLDRIQAGGNKSLVTKEYVDSLNTVFYIDPINGSDSNRGTSFNNAFQTIKRACDTIPIGGYGRIYLIGGPDFNNPVNFDIDSSIYLHKKNIYMTVYSKYPYDPSENLLWAHCVLRNKAQLVTRKHCNPNDNKLYTFVHGFRMYGSSLTLSGQAVYRDATSGNLYNKQTLRIKTPDWIPDPNDGNIYLYSCSHNNGLVCNESLGGGSLELRYIDEINLGDSDLVSQSIAYQAVNISLTSILNIYGTGVNKRAYLSGTIYPETPVMKIAQIYVTFGDDKDGNAYTWQNSIEGVVRDSNNVPRNIQSSFVF